MCVYVCVSFNLPVGRFEHNVMSSNNKNNNNNNLETLHLLCSGRTFFR